MYVFIYIYSCHGVFWKWFGCLDAGVRRYLKVVFRGRGEGWGWGGGVYL